MRLVKRRQITALLVLCFVLLLLDVYRKTSDTDGCMQLIMGLSLGTMYRKKHY